MNSKQRAKLRSLASREDTILQLGKEGVTESFIQSLNLALEARELIKFRVLETAPVEIRQAAGEIAEATGLRPEDILTATEATQQVVSLDLPPEEGGVTPSIESPEDHAINRVLARDILSALPPMERRLIILRFFQDQTQSAAAAELGLSQVAVSRLEKRIINLLKEKYKPPC